MAVKAIRPYEFPSASRQELYGDDQLVNVWFQGSLWFCSAGCSRAPKAMTWADFWNGVVVPFAEEDPDFDPGASRAWTLHGEEFSPRDDATLEELGIGHKDTLGMRVLA